MNSRLESPAQDSAHGTRIGRLNRRLSTAGDSPYVLPGAKDGHRRRRNTALESAAETGGLTDDAHSRFAADLGLVASGGGASLAIIGKTMGHRSTGATKIYARLDLAPPRGG
jgi:hypothetical protein